MQSQKARIREILLHRLPFSPTLKRISLIPFVALSFPATRSTALPRPVESGAGHLDLGRVDYLPVFWPVSGAARAGHLDLGRVNHVYKFGRFNTECFVLQQQKRRNTKNPTLRQKLFTYSGSVWVRRWRESVTTNLIQRLTWKLKALTPPHHSVLPQASGQWSDLLFRKNWD